MNAEPWAVHVGYHFSHFQSTNTNNDSSVVDTKEGHYLLGVPLHPHMPYEEWDSSEFGVHL